MADRLSRDSQATYPPRRCSGQRIASGPTSTHLVDVLAKDLRLATTTIHLVEVLAKDLRLAKPTTHLVNILAKGLRIKEPCMHLGDVVVKGLYQDTSGGRVQGTSTIRSPSSTDTGPGARVCQTAERDFNSQQLEEPIRQR